MPGTMFKGQFMFPKDGLLMKTFSMEMESGNPASRKRLETQLLHFNGREWHGYTYRWNDEQTDATLVESAGQDRVLTVSDPKAPGGKRVQTWHYPSRHECMLCHNPWADYRLAFTLPQLAKDDQISRLEKMAVIKLVADPPEEFPDPDKKPPATLVNPYDTSADLNQRARSYLHVNCSHCHQFGAGGTADIELRADFPLEETKMLEAPPKQGMFGMKDAQILAPGDPYRSVLYLPHVENGAWADAAYRLGVGRRGRRQIARTIGFANFRFARRKRRRSRNLRTLDEATSLARERRNYPRDLKFRCARFGAAERSRRPERRRSETGRRATQARGRRASRVASPRTRRKSIQQTAFLDEQRFAVAARDGSEAAAAGAARAKSSTAAYVHGDPQIRDLFERFVPAEKRVKRLGNVIDVAKLLAVPGDAERGRTLFFASTATQCKNCHRIGEQGGKLGPELTHIAQEIRSGSIAGEATRTVEEDRSQVCTVPRADRKRQIVSGHSW